MEHVSFIPESPYSSIFSLPTSIAIHLLIVLLFLYTSVDYTPIDSLFKKERENFLLSEQHNNSLPAALNPRASAFGVPMQFSDEQWSTDEQEMISQEKEGGDFTSNQVNGAAREDTADEQTLILHELTSQDDASMRVKEQPMQQNVGGSQDQSPQAAKNVSDKPDPKDKVDAPPIDHRSNNQGAQQQGRKRVTVADLAQGFIENLKHEGNDPFKRHGDPHKRPDQEDLKKISYYQKVIWAIQNELKIAQDQLHVPPLNYLVGLHIMIGEQGQLLGVKVEQSSGNAQYDDFIVEGVKRAAPFNPIPKHFGTHSCDLMLAIECRFMREPVRIHMGAHT